MTIVPFTSFMLTLDRCLIFILKGQYSFCWTTIICYVSILIDISIFGMNFILSLFFHKTEKPEGCIAYGCTLLNTSQLAYTYSRTTGVIVNTIIGVLFLTIVTWLRKKKPQIGNKMKTIVEAVVLRAVIFGLICDFAPHVLDTVFISITGDTPFRYIGPYSRVIMAADLFFTSVTNRFVLKSKKQVTKIQVSTVRNSLSFRV